MANEERRRTMEGIPEMYAIYGDQVLGTQAPAISEVERLTNEFEAHESEESKFLKQYKEVAGTTQNRMIKFLLQMIISDEEKHHAITHAMASTLKGDLNWTSPDDALHGLYSVVEEKDKLLQLTEGFILVEKQGIKEYKELIKSSKGYYRDLFVLLFESMIHDSEKHIKILEFLRVRLRDA
jgi:bacterioferritin (cytochrome b1)